MASLLKSLHVALGATSIFHGLVDNESTLWLNAVVGKNNVSTVECWGIQPGFVESTQPGLFGSKILQLGQLSNASYTVFPDGDSIDAGLHTAPVPQYVFLLSGKATLVLPQSPDIRDINFSAGDVVIAADVPGTSVVGHNAIWGGGSVVLQIPFAPNFIPDHETIEGPCPSEDQSLNA